jgi:hypothetical protein
MPAYTIEIEHRDTDQVFSYFHGDKMLHFNATLLARLHKQMPDEFRRITMELDEQTYGLCMNHRGIEEPKVDRLRPRDLREPGYGVLFADDGSFTMVDGHHRFVRRYRAGVRVMDFYVTVEAVWRNCLVEYSPEFDQELAKHMPERATEPEKFASRVIIHGPERK